MSRIASVTRATRRLAVCAIALAPAALAAPAGAAPPAPCSDAQPGVCKRVIGDLKSFTDWLTKYNAKGYIGEVGWPSYPDNPNTNDGPLWNQVGQRWFQAADAAGLPVTGWSAGEWYTPAHTSNGVFTPGERLNIYEQPYYNNPYNPLKPLSIARIQAQVFEAHYGTSGGVNSVGGENTFSGFSNANPGTFGTHWHYDSQTSFNYLKSRGVKVVRLLFRWERVQPTLGGAIATTAPGFVQLKAAIGRANAAGLKVIIEPHNFAEYKEKQANGTVAARKIGLTTSGTSQMAYTVFADFWGKLATALKAQPGLVGFGLMNEPNGLPGTTAAARRDVWEKASQAAVNAIRTAAGTTHTIYVPAHAWDGVRAFATCHPNGPWIKTNATNIRYEAHQYFDRDGSGNYTSNNYASENEWSKTGTATPSC